MKILNYTPNLFNETQKEKYIQYIFDKYDVDTVKTRMSKNSRHTLMFFSEYENFIKKDIAKMSKPELFIAFCSLSSIKGEQTITTKNTNAINMLYLEVKSYLQWCVDMKIISENLLD